VETDDLNELARGHTLVELEGVSARYGWVRPDR
jgi:hypothetical protein